MSGVNSIWRRNTQSVDVADSGAVRNAESGTRRGPLTHTPPSVVFEGSSRPSGKAWPATGIP